MITYNHEKYIREALESVFAQETKFEYEVIIGEDCSTDNTRSVIMEFAARYPDRLFPIYHDVNVGMMRNAFEFCYPRLRGKYVAFLEGDDFWVDNSKLQKQYDYMVLHPGCSACYTNVSTLSGGSLVKHAIHPEIRKDYDKYSVFGEKWIPTLSLFFRKEALPGLLPPQLFRARQGDLFLFCMLAQYGRIVYLDFDSAVYRIHGAGSWSGQSTLNARKSALITTEALRDYFREDPLIRSLINRRLVLALGRLVKMARNLGDHKTMAKMYWKLLGVNFVEAFWMGARMIRDWPLGWFMKSKYAPTKEEER